MALNFTYFELVVSSNVESIGYDPDAEVLQVTFLNGSKYRYSGVPSEVWFDFTDAPSKGKFVWQRLRDKFPYTKV